MATQPYIPGDRFEDVVPNRPGLLTVKELAQALSMSEPALYKFVSDGTIPYLKIGSSLRFRPAAIRKWLIDREYLPRELQQCSPRQRHRAAAQIKARREATATQKRLC